MAASATELANELGLIGLAQQVFEKQISVADFDAAVSHIEDTLRRDAGKLGSVQVIAKDKEAWEQTIRPKVEQSLQLQLRAAGVFHDYTKQPDADLLLRGLELMKQSGLALQDPAAAAAITPGIQEALGSHLGSGPSTVSVQRLDSGKAEPEVEF